MNGSEAGGPADVAGLIAVVRCSASPSQRIRSRQRSYEAAKWQCGDRMQQVLRDLH